MNIQLSVIIWTVICFSLLMLILRNWLFLPVLRVIDERREKLQKARSKAAEYTRLSEECERELREKSAERARIRQEEIKNSVIQIQADEKMIVKQAQRSCLENIEAYRKELVCDHEKILETVSPEMEKAARLLADSIVSK